MKKTILISAAVFACCLLPAAFSFSQGTAINTNGAAPDSSAILDLNSSSKGVLLPRLTTTERNNIVSPASSLLIYNKTTKCFEFFEGGVWQIISCGCTGAPTVVSATATPDNICEGNTLSLTGTATGATSWSWTGPNGFSSDLQNPSITNITTGAAGVYTLTAINSCGSSSPAGTSPVTVNVIPPAPVANAGSGATGNTITANWSASAGAASYFLDVSSVITFAGFVTGYNNLNVGNVVSTTVTGLAAGTTYYYRVRADNTCGTSGNSDTIAYSTTSSCASLGGQLYGGYCWIPTGVRAPDAEINCSDFCTGLGKTCNSGVMQALSQSQATDIVQLFHPGVTMTSSGDAPSYQWVSNTGNWYVEASTCTHNDNINGRERYCVCTPEP